MRRITLLADPTLVPGSGFTPRPSKTHRGYRRSTSARVRWALERAGPPDIEFAGHGDGVCRRQVPERIHGERDTLCRIRPRCAAQVGRHGPLGRGREQIRDWLHGKLSREIFVGMPNEGRWQRGDPLGRHEFGRQILYEFRGRIVAEKIFP